MDYTILVEDKSIVDVMYYNGQEVLSYSIHYPHFVSNSFQDIINKINSNIEVKVNLYQQFIVSRVYQVAVDNYINMSNNGYPIRIFEIFMDYVVTYNQNCAISYVFDQYEYTGGAQSRSLRSSASWDLEEGRMIELSELFHESSDYQQYILDEVRKKIETRIVESSNNYYAYYYNQINEKFNTKNFFLTDEGVVVYFQGYDIAPYATGSLSFIIPYEADVVIPPSCEM